MRDLLHKRGFHFWYCNPGGKPLAEEVTGPRVEPAIAILLNGHGYQMAFHLVTFYTHTLGLRSTLVWEQRSPERCVTCQRAKDRRLGAQPQTIIHINVPTTKAQAAALETYCKNPRVGGVLWYAVFWLYHHELTAAMVICTRTTQDQTSQALPYTEELLT